MIDFVGLFTLVYQNWSNQLSTIFPKLWRHLKKLICNGQLVLNTSFQAWWNLDIADFSFFLAYLTPTYTVTKCKPKLCSVFSQDCKKFSVAEDHIKTSFIKMWAFDKKGFYIQLISSCTAGLAASLETCSVFDNMATGAKLFEVLFQLIFSFVYCRKDL